MIGPRSSFGIFIIGSQQSVDGKFPAVSSSDSYHNPFHFGVGEFFETEIDYAALLSKRTNCRMGATDFRERRDDHRPRGYPGVARTLISRRCRHQRDKIQTTQLHAGS